MKKDEIAQAIWGTLQSPNESDSNFEPANVVDGLYALANAIRFGAKHLGLQDASTPMGAVELLSLSIKEGLKEGLNDISQGIFNGLELIARAIEETRGAGE